MTNADHVGDSINVRFALDRLGCSVMIVFNGVHITLSVKAQIENAVSKVVDELLHFKQIHPIQRSIMQFISWKKPDVIWVKLNVDEVVPKSNGLASTRDVIRNASGDWIS